MNHFACPLALLLIPLALACFALSPSAQADCREGCDLTFGNTFLGEDALVSNAEGSLNTASGAFALFGNTTGSNNTACGHSALFSNTSASGNTAIGVGALYRNSGDYNTAAGEYTLNTNTSGSYNVASGDSALFSNTKGHGNTATGQNALRNNTTGSFNIALGYKAGFNLTTGTNNIDIGNPGFAGESNTVRIGRQGAQTATFIAGISGATVPTGVPVIVDIDGHLGTVVSSERFKDGIKPMDKVSEAILALQPVTFHYKHELDPKGMPQFGLVAEDVAKVNRDLVARDDQGKLYTVRYEAVNAMLLNEFLKEHKAFLEEQRTVEELKKQVAALTAGLQKVSAQLELSKPAPQTVLNKQ